jgi:hypothetical protein
VIPVKRLRFRPDPVIHRVEEKLFAPCPTVDAFESTGQPEEVAPAFIFLASAMSMGRSMGGHLTAKVRKKNGCTRQPLVKGIEEWGVMRTDA